MDLHKSNTTLFTSVGCIFLPRVWPIHVFHVEPVRFVGEISILPIVSRGTFESRIASQKTAFGRCLARLMVPKDASSGRSSNDGFEGLSGSSFLSGFICWRGWWNLVLLHGRPWLLPGAQHARIGHDQDTLDPSTNCRSTEVRLDCLATQNNKETVTQKQTTKQLSLHQDNTTRIPIQEQR